MEGRKTGSLFPALMPYFKLSICLLEVTFGGELMEIMSNG